MPTLRYTARARRDLIDIWLEVSEVNPAAADELYNRLEARVEILRRFPQSGPARPDIAPEARGLIEFPYLILLPDYSGRRSDRSRPVWRAEYWQHLVHPSLE